MISKRRDDRGEDPYGSLIIVDDLSEILYKDVQDLKIFDP
jgi:hypothetical protein